MFVEPGTKVVIDQYDYTVVDGEDPEKVQLKSNENGQVYHVNLLNKIDSGGFVSTLGAGSSCVPSRGPSILSLSPERYEHARRRYNAILPLLKLEARSINDIQEAANKADVNHRSVYYWLKRYENGGGFKGLVTPEGFGGKGKARNKKAESILKQLLEEEIGNAQATPFTTASNFYSNKYLQACKTIGVGAQSARTVRRRVREAKNKLAVQEALGRNFAREPFVRRGFSDKDSPLQTVQIDHSPLDIILLDEITGKVITKRPWLTIALDVYSRCVWGYYLGLQQPNADTVGLTILIGCFRKQDLVNRFGLSDWPVYGKPFQIHTDNGKDFRSRALERGCVDNIINVMRRPVETPEYGPYVERFFGTLETQFVHTLPGTTLSNTKERGKYDSGKKACFTISQLERLLLEYIVNQYHRTIHGGLGKTPLEKWNEGLEGKEAGCPILPREPENKKRFRQDFLPFVEGPDGMRTVEADGVHHKGLVYWADELRLLQSQNGLGKRHFVRFDPSDMRYLNILDGENDVYYELILNSRPPEPFSLRDLEGARRELRAKGQTEPDESIVMETVRRRQQAIRDSIEGSKTARKAFASSRREEQTRGGLSLPPPSNQTHAPHPAAGSHAGLDADVDSAELDAEVDTSLDRRGGS